MPHELGWLNGESLAQAPVFFVPRKLWSGKPKPLDFRLANVLHGPNAPAGTPFTLPGEAWWNLRHLPRVGHGQGPVGDD